MLLTADTVLHLGWSWLQSSSTKPDICVLPFADGPQVPPEPGEHALWLLTCTCDTCADSMRDKSAHSDSSMCTIAAVRQEAQHGPGIVVWLSRVSCDVGGRNTLQPEGVGTSGRLSEAQLGPRCRGGDVAAQRQSRSVSGLCVQLECCWLAQAVNPVFKAPSEALLFSRCSLVPNLPHRTAM